MKYDKPIVAILLGAISSIPYEIFTRILVFLEIGKYSMYQLVSLMVTLDRPNSILGAVSSFIVSGSIATIFYYSLKKLDWDYLIIKSVVASLISWLILESIFMWLIEGRELIPHRPINDYYSEMFGATLYGITQGLLFEKYLLKRYIHR